MNPSMDDIPIAFRETPDVAVKPKSNRVGLIGGLSAVAIVAMVSGVIVSLQLRQPPSTDSAQANPPIAAPSSQPQPAASATTPANSAAAPTSDTLLGHYAYSEAPADELAPVARDIMLRKSAATAFQAMAAAAQADGVSLVPLSGFRSKHDQDYLFFGKKAERGQVATERAKVSAPPGYSEHHTGYAIDIGDGSVPSVDLSESFEQTAAFQWLQANAAHYSFELSFPQGNRQGVSYEPWHWRYVGDIHSLKTFYRARQK
ncbi:M15 family metallopeptidase [Pantanalinema rosaneae CENA516]|uniref:M15 family metallopeptidase n=1 Tax=Pantanalinema rosaneae TaxID=1620701 RepID=UPI003D6E6E47